MVSAPLLAVLMLGDLHFAPWHSGLAFGSSRRRPGRSGCPAAWPTATAATESARGRRVARVWPVGLAAVGRGVPGLALVMVLELGLITSAGVFNPVLVATQLDLTPPDRVARTLSAWTVSTRGVTAALTALWGVLASLAGPRAAIALAGLLLLATPLLLPRHAPAAYPTAEPAQAGRSPPDHDHDRLSGDFTGKTVTITHTSLAGQARAAGRVEEVQPAAVDVQPAGPPGRIAVRGSRRATSVVPGAAAPSSAESSPPATCRGPVPAVQWTCTSEPSSSRSSTGSSMIAAGSGSSGSAPRRAGSPAGSPAPPRAPGTRAATGAGPHRRRDRQPGGRPAPPPGRCCPAPAGWPAGSSTASR